MEYKVRETREEVLVICTQGCGSKCIIQGKVNPTQVLDWVKLHKKVHHHRRFKITTTMQLELD